MKSTVCLNRPFVQRLRAPEAPQLPSPTTPSKTVALTGATGFIGATVMQRLLQAGCRVRALYRISGRHDHPPQNPVVWVPGCLEDTDSLARLMTGADAVVHCAGRVRGVDEKAFNLVNGDGVARLVRAAGRLHPAPRILSLSSLAAREPHVSPYAASKRLGEQLLSAGAARLSWVVLRPPVVYGPGDRETAPLLRWMSRGIAPLVADEKTRFSMIFAEDLAEAVIALLQQPVWKGQVFELHDGHRGGYCWREVIETVSRVTGRPVRGFRLPRILVRSLAGLNLRAARALGYAPMLTPGKVRELTHSDWTADNAAICRKTGWAPVTPLQEGMRRTLACLATGSKATPFAEQRTPRCNPMKTS
ncbi:MAG: NAD-dependent epimerase/dehydratase family protein [Desulfobacterales bacterium]